MTRYLRQTDWPEAPVSTADQGRPCRQRDVAARPGHDNRGRVNADIAKGSATGENKNPDQIIRANLL